MIVHISIHSSIIFDHELSDCVVSKQFNESLSSKKKLVFVLVIVESGTIKGQ